MKKIALIFGIIIGLNIFSCSPDKRVSCSELNIQDPNDDFTGCDKDYEDRHNCSCG